MKTLVLMRHAKSAWDAGDIADHDRPLSERGRTTLAAFQVQGLTNSQLGARLQHGGDPAR